MTTKTTSLRIDLPTPNTSSMTSETTQNSFVPKSSFCKDQFEISVSSMNIPPVHKTSLEMKNPTTTVAVSTKKQVKLNVLSLNIQLGVKLHFLYKKNANQEDSESSSLGDRTTISAAEHVVKKFRQKFIILHYSPFKAVWDWIVLLVVVYTAIFTPFTVAFLLNEDEKRAKLNQHASTRLFKKQQSGADLFVMVDLIVDMMFLMDIFISFRFIFF